jgi:hypothetical protein
MPSSGASTNVGPGRRKRSNPFLRSGIVAAAIAALAFFFIRSVQESRAEPYLVPGQYLSGWTVALERSSDPSAPRLTLQPPQALMPDLFRQVFTRVMESMSTPNPPGMPLVLQHELNDPSARGLGGEAIVAAAREAGLETVTLRPRCMAYRRMSTPGATRQAYFLLFDLPEFTRFRQSVGSLLKAAGGGAAFDPAALSPVLMVSSSDPRFSAWFPLRADPAADCVAPVLVQ